MLDGLKGEGAAPPLVLWALTEEIRALGKVVAGAAAGKPIATVACVMRASAAPRTRTCMQASSRVTRRAQVTDALRHAARVDRMIKGLVKGDVWDELLQLGAALRRARSAAGTAARRRYGDGRVRLPRPLRDGSPAVRSAAQPRYHSAAMDVQTYMHGVGREARSASRVDGESRHRDQEPRADGDGAKRSSARRDALLAANARDIDAARAREARRGGDRPPHAHREEHRGDGRRPAPDRDAARSRSARS